MNGRAVIAGHCACSQNDQRAFGILQNFRETMRTTGNFGKGLRSGTQIVYRIGKKELCSISLAVDSKVSWLL